jgi:signal transduction histidine kinase
MILHTSMAPADAGVERKRIDAMVQAQATMSGPAETLAEVTHDARNMVSALGLYCDLLEQPGVLSDAFLHYGRELRQVASASRQLVERMAGFNASPASKPAEPWRSKSGTNERWPARLQVGSRREMRREGWDCTISDFPVANLASELMATRNLLSALAGAGIALTVDVLSGAKPTRITSEDLTRVLVNLVKNAVEAMPNGGRIQISLREQTNQNGEWLVLAVEDNGPGIPEPRLEQIFKSGYTGHVREDGRPATHRGLGLAITRAIVETAGGRMHAENKLAGGARFVMELPAGR